VETWLLDVLDALISVIDNLPLKVARYRQDIIRDSR
jgi:hypothetical protein